MTRRMVHSLAKAGFDVSGAELYAKARPGYASEVVNYIIDVLGRDKGTNTKRYVEVGSGTGKFTESFLKGYTKVLDSSKKIEWLAVEPSDGFRKEFERTIGTFPNVNIKAYGAPAESLPIKTPKTVDSILIAQAFHWMANIRSLKEFHRVLKPNGTVVMVWNSLDIDIPIISELEDMLNKHYKVAGEPPRYITREWERVFETSEAKELFSQPTCWLGGYQKLLCSRQQIVDRILSISVVSAMSDSGKQSVAQEVLDIINNHPTTRNKCDGEISIGYKSEVAVTQPRS